MLSLACRYRWLCAVLLFISMLLSMKRNEASEASQEHSDWEWINEHFPQLLSEYLPIKKQIEIYVGYRSTQDLYTDVLEYSFIIGFDAKENGYGLSEFLSARVRMADTISIHDQMMKMHISNPQEDVSSIKKKVRLKAWELNEKTCPAIRVQFNKFRKLRFSPPAFDSFVLHPMIHEFHIQAGMGDGDLTLYDFKHPLTKWALETRQALEVCTNPSSSKK